MFNKAGKLFGLKEWLTIPESSKYLSQIFGEDVNDADILRLVLDGHLKLSVYFVNHAMAKYGKFVPYENVEWISINRKLNGLVKDNPFFKKNNRVMKSIQVDDNKYLKLEKDVKIIKGVWDLPMIGAESLDVEFEYHKLTDGPKITLTGISGVFVEGENGLICQIQESFNDNEFQSGSKAQLESIKKYIIKNDIEEVEAKKLLMEHSENREKYIAKRNKNISDDYYPAGGLPDDSVLVVRTKALLELQDYTINRKKNTTSSEMKNIAPLGPSEQHFSLKEEEWTPLKAATLIAGFSYNSLEEILREYNDFKIPVTISEIYKKSYKAFSQLKLEGRQTQYSLDFGMTESDRVFFKKYSPEFLTHDDYKHYYVVVFKPQIYLDWVKNNTKFQYPKEFDLIIINHDSSDSLNAKVLSLSGKEKQELGRLKKEKITMDLTVKAAIDVGKYVEKAKMRNKLIVKNEIIDLINGIDLKIPDTRIDLIWKSIPNEIKSGPGRPKKA